mgnify:CR=1 FL=1
MKHIYLLVFILLLACKTEKNNSNSSIKPVIAPPTVSPDQCLLTGKVLGSKGEISRIIVLKVEEKGSSFNENVYSGDTISVSGDFSFTGEKSILIESIMGMGGNKLVVKEVKDPTN